MLPAAFGIGVLWVNKLKLNSINFLHMRNRDTETCKTWQCCQTELLLCKQYQRNARINIAKVDHNQTIQIIHAIPI